MHRQNSNISSLPYAKSAKTNSFMEVSYKHIPRIRTYKTWAGQDVDPDLFLDEAHDGPLARPIQKYSVFGRKIGVTPY